MYFLCVIMHDMAYLLIMYSFPPTSSAMSTVFLRDCQLFTNCTTLMFLATVCYKDKQHGTCRLGLHWLHWFALVAWIRNSLQALVVLVWIGCIGWAQYPAQTGIGWAPAPPSLHSVTFDCIGSARSPAVGFIGSLFHWFSRAWYETLHIEKNV